MTERPRRPARYAPRPVHDRAARSGLAGRPPFSGEPSVNRKVAPQFTRRVTALLPDEEYREFQASLIADPKTGHPITGTGGLRKIRWSSPGRAKRGGVRIIYYHVDESVREMKAIENGQKKASRTFELPEPDARKIRMGFGLTQEAFARLIGIKVGTLRNWEQGIRRPEGAARVLLHAAARHPEAVRDVCLPKR